MGEVEEGKGGINGDGQRLGWGWWTHSTLYKWSIIELYHWNLYNVINQCHPVHSVIKVLKDTTEWKKKYIYILYILVSDYIKSTYNTSTVITQHRYLNWVSRGVRVSNRHFSKNNTQMANNHIKTHSTSLAIGKMQIQISVKYHFTWICEEHRNHLHLWWLVPKGGMTPNIGKA